MSFKVIVKQMPQMLATVVLLVILLPAGLSADNANDNAEGVSGGTSATADENGYADSQQPKWYVKLTTSGGDLYLYDQGPDGEGAPVASMGRWEYEIKATHVGQTVAPITMMLGENQEFEVDSEIRAAYRFTAPGEQASLYDNMVFVTITEADDEVLAGSFEASDGQGEFRVPREL